MVRLISKKPAPAITELLKERDPMSVAELLYIHNAHVYRFRKDGHVSPTLERALIKQGYVPAPPKRHRSHYEHGRGDEGAKHKAQLQAEMAEAGCDSFTDYVDYLRGERWAE